MFSTVGVGTRWVLSTRHPRDEEGDVVVLRADLIRTHVQVATVQVATEMC